MSNAQKMMADFEEMVETFKAVHGEKMMQAFAIFKAMRLLDEFACLIADPYRHSLAHTTVTIVVQHITQVMGLTEEQIMTLSGFMDAIKAKEMEFTRHG